MCRLTRSVSDLSFILDSLNPQIELSLSLSLSLYNLVFFKSQKYSQHETLISRICVEEKYFNSICIMQANACHNKWLIYWTDRIYWLLYLGGEIVFLYLLYYIYSED